MTLEHLFFRLVLASCAIALSTSCRASMGMTVHKLVYCDFYSIEQVGFDSVCVKTKYRGGRFIIDRPRVLWGKEDNAKSLEMEDGKRVVLSRGSRMVRHLHEFCASVTTSLHVISGSDLPEGISWPDGFCDAPLLLAIHYRNAFDIEAAEEGRRYVVNPVKSTCVDIATMIESRFFFPYKNVDVPDSWCAPVQVGAIGKKYIAGIIHQAETAQEVEEREFWQLQFSDVVSSSFNPGETGSRLYRTRERSDFIRASFVQLEKTDDHVRIIGRVEIYKSGICSLSEFDNMGRLFRCLKVGRHPEHRKGFRLLRIYAGDGMLSFGSERNSGEDCATAFVFREGRVDELTDRQAIEKKNLECDEHFRKLFGFEGTGELTPEQIEKRLAGK